MRVLELELRTSGRTASTLNHRAISPAPPLAQFIKDFVFLLVVVVIVYVVVCVCVCVCVCVYVVVCVCVCIYTPMMTGHNWKSEASFVKLVLSSYLDMHSKI